MAKEVAMDLTKWRTSVPHLKKKFVICFSCCQAIKLYLWRPASLEALGGSWRERGRPRMVLRKRLHEPLCFNCSEVSGQK
jgi:hypothetical protein